MSLTLHKIKFTDIKNLSVEIEFIIACSRIEGNELIKLSLENTEAEQKFKTAVSKVLRSIKKDGVIQLFVFENELKEQDKTESVYLLNKFPFLSGAEESDSCSVYMKL